MNSQRLIYQSLKYQKAYANILQTYRDKKIRVCGKDSILLLFTYLCIKSQLEELEGHNVVPVMFNISYKKFNYRKILASTLWLYWKMYVT